MENGLKKAIEVCGSGAALAKKLNLTKNAIYNWDVIPWARIEQVADVTGLPILSLHPTLRAALKSELQTHQEILTGKLSIVGGDCHPIAIHHVDFKT